MREGREEKQGNERRGTDTRNGGRRWMGKPEELIGEEGHGPRERLQRYDERTHTKYKQ